MHLHPADPSRATTRYRRPARLLALLAALALLGPAASADAELSFQEQSLELPGAPATLVPADLDGDGLGDLAVVVIYTDWDQIGIEELTEMDQVEGLVEVLTIVPTLMDRREVRVYRGRPGGGFALAGEPLPLPLGVLSVGAGPPGAPVLALTDDGAAALRLDAGGRLSLEPLVADPPVLAGTGTYLAGLDLVEDVSGDGVADLLLPAADGIDLYRGRADAAGGGLEAQPFARVPYPDLPATAPASRDVPLPSVLDADGNGLPDLLFRRPGQGLSGLRVALQTAPGRFAPAAEVGWPHGHGASADDSDGSPVWIGPVDAAPGAELVVTDSTDEEDVGMRKELAQAREPHYRVRVHPFAAAAAGGSSAPLASFDVTGFVEDSDRGSDTDFTLPGGFLDLNGDGLTDLVSVTNDISFFKAMRVLATWRLTLELGFHLWCQQPDGRFVRAPGEPPTSTLTIDLRDLALRQRSLFAGDFDGDGLRDFLALGRARQVGIHRGRADCSYPERPDRTLRLREPLRDLALATIDDLDGDGLDDLAVTQPQPVDEAGVSPPVRLDLYLSARTAGGGR